jgi:hypothetical protein
MGHSFLTKIRENLGFFLNYSSRTEFLNGSCDYCFIWSDMVELIIGIICAISSD